MPCGLWLFTRDPGPEVREPSRQVGCSPGHCSVELWLEPGDPERVERVDQRHGVVKPSVCTAAGDRQEVVVAPRYVGTTEPSAASSGRSGRLGGHGGGH